MKTHRDKLDIIFSLLVRERANWTCEACNGYHEEGQRQNLHCSHIFSRRKQSVRFDPRNAVAHCFSCHQRLGENPADFACWAGAHLGGPGLDKLRFRSNEICKRSKRDKEDLYQDMKAAYAHMLERRRSGETGRLEFEL